MTAPRAASSPLRAGVAAILAVLCGAAAGFAHPPFGFLPGLFGFAGLLRLADADGADRPLRTAALRGVLGGLGYFVVCVWWLAEPFQVDAREQGWMAPFAVAGMSVLLALFWAAAFAAYRAFSSRGVTRVLLFAAVLALAEWLRSHLLTGFPWDLPGAAWPAGSPPSQAAALIGIQGLTLLTLAVAASPGVVLEGRAGRWTVAAGAVLLAILWGYGAWRLAGAGGAPTALRVAIVQADVRQENKYDSRLFASIVGRYVSLTAAPLTRRADVVVWPEGSIPAAFDDYLAPGTWTRQAIEDALRPGQVLILGGYRYGTDRSGAPVIFNALAVLRRTAGGLEPAGVYDKFRLVPFGEYMPLDGLVSRLGVKQMVHVGDGFAPGPRPRPMSVAGLPPFQPLICYESLFSGFTREGARAARLRPQWIVNISNDAWFGTQSGPAQHLNLASYRAIEEGLPMARATPTGISAMIDPFGRAVAGTRLGEGVLGVSQTRLPAALAPTSFDRWGEGPFWLLLAVSAIVGSRLEALRRRDRRPTGTSA